MEALDISANAEKLQLFCNLLAQVNDKFWGTKAP